MKGVSPVVSTVLMVAIAIAVAVVAYSWFMSMQATIQAGASRSAGTVGKDSVFITGVKCFDSNDLNIYVRNPGDEDLNGNFTILIRDATTRAILDHNTMDNNILAGSEETFELVDVQGLSNCKVDDNDSEYVIVEIVTPGGASYSKLERIAGMTATSGSGGGGGPPAL